MQNFSLLSFLENNISLDEPFILGCSTGADSMFLLYKILETPYRKNLIAAYFNHNTRKQCKEEESFLLKIGKKEGFKVEIWECDFEKIKALYPSKSFEELAREKRYQFFDALCHIHKAEKVLLAHHLDDRIETMLFNMLRGTKLTGLINMQEKSGNILRPLLSIEKRDILEFLKKNKLKYFEDKTNRENIYTRNFIRNEIIPKVSEVHPEYKKNISQLLKYFESLKNHIDREVSDFLKTQESLLKNKKCFSINWFLQLTNFLQKEVIRIIYFWENNNSTFGLTEWNIKEIIRFIGGRNNNTIKEIHRLKMKKQWDLIFY